MSGPASAVHHAQWRSPATKRNKKMGWEVRFRRGDGASPPPCCVGSHPDALTHARILLGNDRAGVVEVREEGSERGTTYRLTDQGMIPLEGKAVGGSG
jgi:hypothetical protein